ncbi:5-formyltetrahydrofolate cyclo-ligase [Anaerobacillus isosaccharinicus]|uniref:5-formyltetrahydrofolate cyclo-ligase n=1 Tax=Anaerobacillus isosaccharinicus TaxID=1532552 RepID=A0A1S2LS35_9BACI|nr:5-formyltetrahydrofolate cyclo-ligase [Anaerobacillus isosaccharinicus]MBA5585551.1 5-formyltetrahydrofolate cyclo-ligase [Anaerobacillus isosaccharinicus]QOY36135.1 5-formyltetrahydrofolate cyclo-ligase [Anaerobacillus isosaccharinicus]
MNKGNVREEIKKKLLEMNDIDYWALSTRIKDELINSNEWAEALTIGLTISTGREVDTKEIIEEGWRQNKRIVVPKCFPKNRELRFYQFNSFQEVEDSFYSLKEPIISVTPYVPKNEIDLMVVPGIVYDKRGFRIGYGGGYYDRYLSNYTNKTISLAFGLQIVDEVPVEEHDVAVEKLISI